MTASATSDSELLSLLRSGSEAAFTEIYNRYWDKLFYKAARKLSNLAIAEELVQDIFMDLWQRRSSLQVTGELNSYLAVAMKYKVINAQAKMKRAAGYEQYTATQVKDVDHTTEQWLCFEELRQRLEKLVTRLPEKCRLVYSLREKGLTQQEIADELNVSVKTVDTHVSRALKFLRKGLSGLFSFLSI